MQPTYNHKILTMKKYIPFVSCIAGFMFINSCNKTGSISDPTADFSFTGDSCTAPCEIVFKNKSRNATSYSWSFGDGIISTVTNPTKIYAVSGNYIVILAATGGGITESVIKRVTILGPNVKISSLPMTIFLPNNCAQSFVITNTGSQESLLNYNVYNSGILGPDLNFNSPSGTLRSGDSARILVTVKPSAINTPYLIGSTLGIEVSTPQVASHIQTFLSVDIRSMNDLAQNLLGTWSGTWSGKSYGAANPAQASPDTSVSGTWTLNAQTVNPANNTASGTVTWNGTDAYWTYTFDNYGNITSATPQTFNATRTVSFNSSNATLITPVPGGGCDRFRLIINDFPSSTYGIYGPRLVLDMDLRANTVTTSGSSFTAWPYAPVFINNLSSNQSNGSLSGRKL